MKTKPVVLLLLAGIGVIILLGFDGPGKRIESEPSPVQNASQPNSAASVSPLPSPVPCSTNQGGGGWDNASDACHIDVNCCDGGVICLDDADSWRALLPPVRSAVLLYFPERTENQYCGGVLVNNTSLDFTPYVMTAWHCAGDKWETEAPTIEFYWNYEHPMCRPRKSYASGQPGAGRTDQFRKGAIVRDEWKYADLVLLELYDPPSSDQEWEVFYAGWDAVGSLPIDGSIYVHFPNWSEKRITFDYDQIRYASVQRDWGYVSSLMVDDWELGGFQGSSGSPLFNTDNRLVGVGSSSPDAFWEGSACEPPPPDGARWTGYFGRLRDAWITTGRKGTKLRHWLDPCNTMFHSDTWEIWDGIDLVSPFADVPVSHPQYFYIDALYRAGFVAGCGTNDDGDLLYCPEDILDRAESAVFVERGYHDTNLTPPQPSFQRFSDLPSSSWAAKWAEALYQDGFTAGCQTGNEPLKYCPWQEHTRAEAAVFFLRMLHGPEHYSPPAAEGIFDDAPTYTWYADWVEAAYEAKLMFPCQSNPLSFCPETLLTRAAAAEIMVRAKGLPLPCPPGSAANPSMAYQTGIAASHDSQMIAGVKQSTYLGGSGNEEGNAIAVDDAGNVYIAGYTDSDDLPGCGSVAGGRDAFVAKSSSTGQLVYVICLGGAGLDEATRIAVDEAGNLTILGHTDSTDFPTQNSWQSTLRGVRDLFVTRLDADGQIVFSTYLGGSDSEEGFGLAVDNAGNTYITGRTISTNLPVTANAWQSNNAGGYDAFVTKFNHLGILIYSTYLGGSGNDAAQDLALDEAGNVYLVGHTGSSDLVLAGNPLQNSLAGANDAFVAKLSADRVLVYSTYLGGANGDFGSGIAVDGAGRAYVTGYTASSDFALQNPLQNTHGGSSYDAFLAKLDTNGSTLVYSTFFGGSGGDEGHDVFLDDDGAVTLTGLTGSIDLPTAGAVATTIYGSQDTFITRLASDGSLLYSRYLGGNAGELGKGLFVDEAGDVYVTGYTLSPNFPLARALQEELGGERDAFVVRIGEQRVCLPLIMRDS